MACCPEPYKACDKSSRVLECDSLIAPHLSVLDKSAAPADLYRRVQQARGALRNGHENCQMLPAELPHAGCGGSSTLAAFDRRDIFCEMMLWQSEQMGDGNEK